MKHERTKPSEPNELNGLKLVVDVAIMSAAISRIRRSSMLVFLKAHSLRSLTWGSLGRSLLPRDSHSGEMFSAVFSQ